MTRPDTLVSALTDLSLDDAIPKAVRARILSILSADARRAAAVLNRYSEASIAFTPDQMITLLHVYNGTVNLARVEQRSEILRYLVSKGFVTRTNNAIIKGDDWRTTPLGTEWIKHYVLKGP